MKHNLLAAVLVMLACGPATAQSSGSGEKLFKKCAGCHQVGPGAKNRLGPVLTDVVGRVAGTYDGYKYSKSMLAARDAGLVWSDENIFGYVADPSGFLREFLNDPRAKAKMTFKLKGEQDRRDVIAYLGQFQAASAGKEGGGFCIVNASQNPYIFATETREGVRQVSNLLPGDQLCAVETGAVDGIVAVYNGSDDYEGCSRIISAGATEEMLEYAEAGRCGWSSHNS